MKRRASRFGHFASFVRTSRDADRHSRPNGPDWSRMQHPPHPRRNRSTPPGGTIWLMAGLLTHGSIAPHRPSQVQTEPSGASAGCSPLTVAGAVAASHRIPFSPSARKDHLGLRIPVACVCQLSTDRDAATENGTAYRLRVQDGPAAVVDKDHNCLVSGGNQPLRHTPP
jgi:hypothetical protein